MRGRGARPVAGGNAASDLLVCFPSRAHLSLMHKPICSPARHTETARRHHSKTSSRGQASPLFRAKSRPTGAEIAEPTSPKVTCAGQIKIKSKPGNCKNWQSVMEEIERLHSNQKSGKGSNWVQALGFKKDIMHFMTCLRSLRFHMRCFGSFPGAVDDSDSSVDEEEEGEESEDFSQNQGIVGESGDSTTVFSKWLMILQENQQNQLVKEEVEDEGGSCIESSIPPKNALLLMRCKSAPAKSWLEGEQEEEEKKSAKLVLEEEKKDKENQILKSYAPDFYKVSMDIVKETWVGRSDPFSRSRSWKR